MLLSKLTYQQERLSDREIPSKKYSNLTKEEHDALYSLRDDSTIIIKGTDKDSIVVVREREEYFKKAYKQLEVWEEFPNGPSVLVNTIVKALEKIHLRGDFSSNTLDYYYLYHCHCYYYYYYF